MLTPGDKGFVYFDDEEKELIETIEASVDEMTPLTGDELARTRSKLSAAARTTQARLGNKTERMNIRMTADDMEALKREAAREGLAYQSLVTSILHKYTQGRLVDIDEARKLIRR